MEVGVNVRASEIMSKCKRAHLTCDPLQQSAHIEDALLHDALEAHGEHRDECHGAQQQDPCGQEDGGSLPEPAGNLPEVNGVGAAQYAALHVGQFDAAAVDAQSGPVGFSGCGGPMGAKDRVRCAGESHQPVSAHEGNELSECCHDAQQSPQHGAAGDNDMAHAGGGWTVLVLELQPCGEVKRWNVARDGEPRL